MGRRPLPEDFKDFIRFLNSNEVEYLLVGGWAVGCYGNPRATKDIDFLIAVDDENLKRLEKTFNEFVTSRSFRHRYQYLLFIPIF